MNADLRNAIEKLAWLELYVPLDGTTRRLAEKLIRRGVKKSVAPNSVPTPQVQNTTPQVQNTTPQVQDTIPENTEHKPVEAPVPPPQDFQHKVAGFKAKYERS